jgi:outer membrane receptor for ferrienterochelin and colicin
VNGFGQVHPAPVEGKIQGIVIDKEFKDALPFSHISLIGLNQGTYTGEDGIFNISGVPAGIYDIVISFLGYQKQILRDVEIIPGNEDYLTIEMEPAIIEAREVVVTAAKKEQHFSLAPVSIELLTAKQIEEQNLSTFDQAFDQMNGLNVTRSSGSNVQAVSIRGASEVAGGGIGNRVLLLIDGRPAISPDSGGALWNLVPLSSVDRIEVVKGAYSSLFGSSAMGGVVNVITRKPGIRTHTNLHLNYGFHNKAPASTGYDKFNDYYTIALSRSGSSGRMSYIFDASLRSTDGHREKTAYDLFNIYGKFKYKFSGQRSLILSGNFNKIKNDTPATWFSASQAYSVAPYRIDDYQDRRETNLDVYYEAIASEKLKYSSRFYYYQNDSEFSFNDDPANDTTNVNIGTSQVVASESVLSRRIGNVTQLDWYSNDKHYIIVGVDSHYDHINGLPDTVLYGKHKAFNFGIYVQDEYKVSDKLKLTAGLRYDNYRIIDEFKESNISPKIALLYQWNKKFTSRALFSQAYRNPSMAERFIKFEQGGGLKFQPNPNLESEQLNISLEFGNKYRISEQLSFDVALFYNKYNNLISFQQLSNAGEALLYKVINLKEALMQGAEAQVNFRNKNGTSVNLGYTFLDARDISDNRLNDNLAYKIKHSAYVALNQELSNWVVNLNGRYRSAIKEVFIYPGNEPDAYLLFNARVAYSFGDNHSAYLSVQNISDTQYEELERYRMAGRSYTFGLRFEW